MNRENRDRDYLGQLAAGEWMYGFGDDVKQDLLKCEELCFRLNALPPSRQAERNEIVKELFGSIGEAFTLHSPFRCDFGVNIRIGRRFVGNFNLTILDEGEVTIGNNVFIGPNVSLCTITHACCADQRNAGVMRARPIRIGDNVWIAAGVTVLPGVSIGDEAVVGAGSVVTRDIPPRVLAAGNPCRVIRAIGENDRVCPILAE